MLCSSSATAGVTSGPVTTTSPFTVVRVVVFEVVPAPGGATAVPDPGPTVNRDTVTFAVPWLLLVLLVIAAAIWGFLRLRRARDEKTARDWIAYTEAEARRKARDEGVVPVGTDASR